MIDLPEDVFRAAKMRAVQQGSSLKELITNYVRLGLSDPSGSGVASKRHRRPPPVAIRKNSDLAPSPALSNKQLNKLLEDEEVERVLKLSAKPDDRT